MILSVYSLTALSFSASYGFLRRVLSIRKLLTITAFSMGIGLFAASMVQGVPAFLVIIVIVGIGAGLTDPAVNSIVLARAPEAGRARAIGVVVSAFFIGQVLTPAFTDPVRRFYSIGHAFAFEGVLLLAVGIVVLLSAYFASSRGHAETKQPA